MTDRPKHTPEFDRLPDHLAQRVLARASEIDASGAAVTDLREAAREAGISPQAFEAALAEIQGAAKVSVAEEPRRPRRRARRGRMAVAFAIGAFIASLMYGRARSVPDVPATSERIFQLNCLPAGEASLLLRPLIKSPYSQVVAPGGNPRVLIVRGTPEELTSVGAFLNERDGTAGKACPAPTVAR